MSKYQIYTAESKIAILKEFEESGMTRSAFCKARSLNPNTFNSWLERVKAGEASWHEAKTYQQNVSLIDLKEGTDEGNGNPIQIVSHQEMPHDTGAKEEPHRRKYIRMRIRNVYFEVNAEDVFLLFGGLKDDRSEQD